MYRGVPFIHICMCVFTYPIYRAISIIRKGRAGLVKGKTMASPIRQLARVLFFVSLYSFPFHSHSLFFFFLYFTAMHLSVTAAARLCAPLRHMQLVRFVSFR